MIARVKGFIRKSNAAVKLYFAAVRLGKLLLNDLFHPQKLFLLLRVLPYTMVGYERLSNVYDLTKQVEENRMKGALVECGVWRGGTIGIMAYIADRAKSGRQIWLFDSFEGLPEPSKEDGDTASVYSSEKNSGKLISIEKCVGPLEDVKKLFFVKLKLNPENIWIAKGWFQDTLPAQKEKIGPIAILRLDADWYESTKVALESLYDYVVPGGYVVIDDYGHWEGCRKAVDEFLAKRNIRASLRKIDYTGVYFQK